MEYLMTYGWAILVMGIILSALFVLGVFNPGTFAGQECLLEAGFSCLNIYLSPNGLLDINLMQATQSPIKVTAIGCSENASVAKMQAPNPPTNSVFLSIGANYTFPVQCYNQNNTPISLNPGSIFSGYIIINYTSITTGFPSTLTGRIITRAS
ncbi:MAG: hypothetical protein ACP5FN_01265 [Candidatus Micrarchaeia archaeon]